MLILSIVIPSLFINPANLKGGANPVLIPIIPITAKPSKTLERRVNVKGQGEKRGGASQIIDERSQYCSPDCHGLD